MCEPLHSFIQVSSEQFNAVNMNSLSRYIKVGQVDHARRVNEHAHLSAFGSGHHHIIYVHGLGGLDVVQWEADWAIRELILDYDGVSGRSPYTHSSIHQHGMTRLSQNPGWELAMENAQEYANRVSIGSTKALRQFITNSFNRTEKPYTYCDKAMDMLSQDGRNAFRRKVMRATGMSRGGMATSALMRTKPGRQSITNILCGLTRKRKYMNCAWADDTELWENERSEVSA